MTTIYDDAPSKTLRYNESQAIIKASSSPGYTDPLLGRKGFAHYNSNEGRWYFREEGTDDNRWVHFNQISFVPMIGDKILVSSSDVPFEYHWDRYNSPRDAQSIEDHTVRVTSVTHELSDNASYVRIHVTGEVKSRQKPDDTEQVAFNMPTNTSILLPWTFAEAVAYPDESERRATLFHDFHRVSVRLWEMTREKRDYSSDIELIGSMLENEAESRNWCSEYDQFIDRFNAESKIAFIDPREKDFDVTVDVTVTMTVPVTISVTARSGEDAEALVSDDASSYIDDAYVQSSAQSGDWSIHIDDYEVSDVTEA